MTGLETAGAVAAGAEAAADASAAAGTAAAVAAAVPAVTATATGLAGTFASVSPYLAGASALLSGIGSLTAGQQRSDVLQQNALNDRINAGTANDVAEATAARNQTTAIQRVAAGQNAFGASGVVTSSGSPLDVLANQAGQGALDSEIARWKGQTQGNAYLVQSGQATTQAAQAADAGIVQAGSTLLTAGARYAASSTPSPRYGNGSL